MGIPCEQAWFMGGLAQKNMQGECSEMEDMPGHSSGVRELHES